MFEYVYGDGCDWFRWTNRLAVIRFLRTVLVVWFMCPRCVYLVECAGFDWGESVYGDGYATNQDARSEELTNQMGLFDASSILSHQSKRYTGIERKGADMAGVSIEM